MYKIVHFVRDFNNTGGGLICLKVAQQQAINNEVIIITDIHCEEKYDDLVIKVIPFGKLLNKRRNHGKFLKTFFHFSQIINFNIQTLFLYFYYKIKGYYLYSHNNEALISDAVLVHNVFSSELRNGKLIRILNPVMFVRVLKEQIFLRSFRGAIYSNSNETTLEIKNCIGKSNVIYAPSGVDCLKYKSLGLNKSCDGNYRLLFVGHEFERKGLRYILEALKLLPINVILDVVGGRGSSMEKYTELVKYFDISERVNFHGSQTNLLPFYDEADIFIMPSSYEGIPLVCLESLASGLPNLVTYVGGMKDIIIPGFNGAFIERNSKDIAEKIFDLISDSVRLSDISSNARKSVEQYDWKNVLNIYTVHESVNFD